MKTYEASGLCVDVRYLVLGPLQNNVYIVSDGAGTMVVDPSCKADVILQALDGAHVDAVVLTHSHFDHTGAACALREATGAPVVASKKDAPLIERPSDADFGSCGVACPVDRRVKEGDVVEVGGMRWKVIETPGHTKGSICLLNEASCGNHLDGMSVLISGDTLFCGTVGRTDFEGGSMSDMRASIAKLAKLPDDVAVLPGHNSFTTIAAERNRVFAMLGGA